MYFTGETVKWITTHPMQAALTDLKKTVLLWLIDWYNTSSRNLLYIALTLATFACFVLGLYRMRKNKAQLSIATYWEGTRIVAGWLIYYTLIIIAFFSAPRLQIILIGIYVPILGYGVESILEKVFYPLLLKKKF
jgi:heme/copper-type cytochrome/quinol oxidase subunit 2